MPDTVENQKEYPQPSTQKSGCGFPIAKIGVIFSLVTGAAVALCIDVLNTHDIKLARNLYSFLKPNDVLVGDRAFCAYADMFTIKKLDCDARLWDSNCDIADILAIRLYVFAPEILHASNALYKLLWIISKASA